MSISQIITSLMKHPFSSWRFLTLKQFSKCFSYLTDLFYNPSLDRTTDSQQIIPILITLVVEERGSEELLQEVKEEMQNIGTELNINITVGRVDRFGNATNNSLLISS